MGRSTKKKKIELKRFSNRGLVLFPPDYLRHEQTNTKIPPGSTVDFEWQMMHDARRMTMSSASVNSSSAAIGLWLWTK